jgi:hypothetical protein
VIVSAFFWVFVSLCAVCGLILLLPVISYSYTRLKLWRDKKKGVRHGG